MKESNATRTQARRGWLLGLALLSLVTATAWAASETTAGEDAAKAADRHVELDAPATERSIPFDAQRWMPGDAPFGDLGVFAGGGTNRSCYANCDQVWDTCVDFAFLRYDCCLDYCAGPAECSLCRFWLRTDVLICSWQRCVCRVEGCDGLPEGTCGKAPQPAGQSPPDPCFGI